MTGWDFLVIGVALGISNFGYQFFGTQDWSCATERTYFQASALLVAWIFSRLAQ